MQQARFSVLKTITKSLVEEVRARAKLDSIVTVVDAKHLAARLEDSHETAEQIAFADTILVLLSHKIRNRVFK